MRLFTLLFGLAIAKAAIILATDVDKCSKRIYVEMTDHIMLSRPADEPGCSELVVHYQFNATSSYGYGVIVTAADVRGFTLTMSAHVNGEVHEFNKRRMGDVRRSCAEEGNCGIYNTPIGTGLVLSYRKEGSVTAEDLGRFQITVSKKTDDFSCHYPIITPSSSVSIGHYMVERDGECEYRIRLPTNSWLISWMTIINSATASISQAGVEEPIWIRSEDGPYRFVHHSSSPEGLELVMKADEHTYLGALMMKTIIMMQDPCECNTNPTHLTNESDSVNLLSPGFPKLYCPTYYCERTITVEEVPEADRHSAFFVQIDYIGGISTASLIIEVDEIRVIKRTGDEHFTQPRTYPGTRMKFKFSSTRDGGISAYNVTVKRVTLSNDCLCPSLTSKLYSKPGSFSIELPSHCHPITCRFKISENEETTKILRMKTVYQFPTAGDTLILKSNEGEITRYVHEDSLKKTRNLPIRTSRMFIVFERTNIEPLTVEESSSFFNISWIWDDDCICEKFPLRAKDYWDHFVSPNYPHKYCHDVKCSYLIKAQPGTRIALNVTEFDTEPHSDWLRIYDGNSTDSPLLKKLAGLKTSLELIESNGNVMLLEFHSDDSEARKGFVINYLQVNESSTEAPKPSTPARELIISPSNDTDFDTNSTLTLSELQVLPPTTPSSELTAVPYIMAFLIFATVSVTISMSFIFAYLHRRSRISLHRPIQIRAVFEMESESVTTSVGMSSSEE